MLTMKSGVSIINKYVLLNIIMLIHTGKLTAVVVSIIAYIVLICRYFSDYCICDCTQ